MRSQAFQVVVRFTKERTYDVVALDANEAEARVLDDLDDDPEAEGFDLEIADVYEADSAQADLPFNGEGPWRSKFEIPEN